MPTLSGRLDLLEAALPALKKGNVLDFTYLPGVGTLVRGQGREMPIPGKDFADALFSVWLGPKPISEALKRQLLSGPPSAPVTPAEPAQSGHFIVRSGSAKPGANCRKLSNSDSPGRMCGTATDGT
jgi:hypothetical protein